MTAEGAASPRQLLIIGGPGRSGTSLVTGLISRLGYHVPQPELAANVNNPRGFGESVWPLKFHKRLMKQAGLKRIELRARAYDRVARVGARPEVRDELAAWLAAEFETADRLVIKDPRLLWFVDLYQGAAAANGAHFGLLTMARHPAETVRSARMRDSRHASLVRSKATGAEEPVAENASRATELTEKRIPPLVRTAAWINGALTLERTSRTVPRVFVDYEDLMADWRTALGASEQALGMGLVSAATDEQLADAALLVEPSLRRSRPEWSGMYVPKSWQATADRTYQAMLAADADDEHGRHELDQLFEQYRTRYGMVATARAWTGVEAVLRRGRV